MPDRVVTIHAFCSVKGGVGKSTLAVACAKLLAESGRKPILIDADLTGTSLADGLRLCAPELATRQDGSADLEAPTGRRLSRAETIAARRARADTSWDEVPPPPPFLNDILIHGHERALYDEDLERECTVEPLLWRHEKDDGVAYLPSSPLRADVEIALGWLYRARQFTWIRRMTWLLEGMREQMRELTDVVIDLPPGMFGFSHEVLALMAHLSKDEVALPLGFPSTWGGGRWIGRPFLVTTPDLNDVVVALEYLIKNQVEIRTIQLLVNRTRTSIEEIRAAAREHFGPVLSAQATTKLTPVGELRGTLDSVFTTGDLRMTPEVRALQSALRIDAPGTRP